MACKLGSSLPLSLLPTTSLTCANPSPRRGVPTRYSGCVSVAPQSGVQGVHDCAGIEERERESSRIGWRAKRDREIRGEGNGGRRERKRERTSSPSEAATTAARQPERCHGVCGATILIRRWIYGLNHRRIISDSRALLPPTETYACLFADNCTQLRARSASLFRSRFSVAGLSTLFSTFLCFFLSVLPSNMTFPDLLSGHQGFP